MSFVVSSNGDYVWGPANRTGTYFLGTVGLLEDMLNCESGVTSPLSQTIEVDNVKLNEFLRSAIDFFEKTSNPPLFTMVTGTMVVLLAISLRVNDTIPKMGFKTNEWDALARDLFNRG